MACLVPEDSSDCSEDQGDREADGYDGYSLDIKHIGEVFNYTIPTFNVFTVKGPTCCD